MTGNMTPRNIKNICIYEELKPGFLGETKYPYSKIFYLPFKDETQGLSVEPKLLSFTENDSCSVVYKRSRTHEY